MELVNNFLISIDPVNRNTTTTYPISGNVNLNANAPVPIAATSGNYSTTGNPTTANVNTRFSNQQPLNVPLAASGNYGAQNSYNSALPINTAGIMSKDFSQHSSSR